MADELLKLSRKDQREVIVATAPDLRPLSAVIKENVWVKFCDNLSQNLAAPIDGQSVSVL